MKQSDWVKNFCKTNYQYSMFSILEKANKKVLYINYEKK